MNEMPASYDNWRTACPEHEKAEDCTSGETPGDIEDRRTDMAYESYVEDAHRGTQEQTFARLEALLKHAKGEAASLRDSNRVLVARVRELERQVTRLSIASIMRDIKGRT